MMPFELWARSPERDRQADQVRFQRLLEALTELSSQVEHETEGLQARYVRVSDSAALLSQCPEGIAVIADPTSTMARCLARIAALQGHIAFIEMLRQSVLSYAEEVALEAVSVKNGTWHSHH